VSPKWLTALVRARQLQEDAAQRDLAAAERLARRAHGYVRHNAERLESLSTEDAKVTVPAFVAAAVALQAAAATHAAAVASAEHARVECQNRRAGLREAARARRTAEDLHEKASAVEARQRASAEQRAYDEVAAGVHRRTNPEPVT
jgi:flagellar export protein FliJ